MIKFLWTWIMNEILKAKPELKDQISEDLSKRIIDFLSRHVDIVAIYIFGSVATAKNRSGSDIDVAIMVRGQVNGMERVQLETSLSNILRKDVDLIIFGEATPLLQHQILKYGDLITKGTRRNGRGRRWQRDVNILTLHFFTESSRIIFKRC